jgi:hypothetical protein
MTLATEPPDTPTTAASEHPTLLESWPHNERMRHVPSAAWMMEKLDGDLRRKVEALLAVYASTPHEHPLHGQMERELRALCRWLDRVAEVARRARGNHHPPNDLAHRISWAISHAVSNLSSVDAATFGHRYPFQTFERSNAEPLWAALLSVIEHVHRLVELARQLDPGIDERIYEGLVSLKTPLDPRPIA